MTMLIRADVLRASMLVVFAMIPLSVIIAVSAPVASAQTESDAAGELAYGLSGLERDGNFDRLYKLMHPDAKAVVPRSAVVGWYREDFAPQHPQEISEILEVRQVSWTWEVTGKTYSNFYEVDYIQPFGVGPNYEYVTNTVRLVPSSNSFGWFFGRSMAFVEEQIGRFPGQLESTNDSPSQSQTRSSSTSSQVSSTGCTLVELYPGYRGNVTGVMPHWNGLGDWDCLESLEKQNPSFNRVSEDQANQEAADALGISGSMELWTWENWMQIEAERGMTPSCYTCLMLDTSSMPLRTDVPPDPSDYRIATGLLGNVSALTTLIASAGITSAYQTATTMEFFGNDDYVVRSLAYLSGGPYQNAQELYESMRHLIDRSVTLGGSIADVSPWRELLHIAIWQRGGYAPTPDFAPADDQVMLVVYSFGAARIGMGDINASSYFRELDRSTEAWLLQSGSLPLDSYMQQQSVWQQFQ